MQRRDEIFLVITNCFFAAQTSFMLAKKIVKIAQYLMQL